MTPDAGAPGFGTSKQTMADTVAQATDDYEQGWWGQGV